MHRVEWIRCIAVLCGLALTATGLHAQEDSAVRHRPGVEPHAGLDAVYEAFHDGYRTLKAETVGGLYTEDALYLSPGSDVRRGRQTIEDNFRSYFDQVREEEGRLTIRFEILDRDVSGDLACDVGYYILERTSEDDTHVSKGKFVVVARRLADGAWKFHVDGFSDVPTPGS